MGTIRIILGIVVFVLSSYSLLTHTLALMPYYMFFLGALLMVTGIAKLKKNRKGFWGHVNIVISLFVLFASLHEVFFQLTGV